MVKVRRVIDDAGLPIRLEVDGGISVENIREVADAGADMFVAGSAIFNSNDYSATIRAMRKELGRGNQKIIKSRIMNQEQYGQLVAQGYNRIPIIRKC